MTDVPAGMLRIVPQPVGGPDTPRWTDHPAKDPLAERHFEVLGWTYYTRVDHEDADDGNQKIGHYAVRGEEVAEFDYSPYSTIAPDDFAMLVRLQFKPQEISSRAGAEVRAAYHLQRSHVLYGIEGVLAVYASVGHGMSPGCVRSLLESARRYPLPADMPDFEPEAA